MDFSATVCAPSTGKGHMGTTGTTGDSGSHTSAEVPATLPQECLMYSDCQECALPSSPQAHILHLMRECEGMW